MIAQAAGGDAEQAAQRKDELRREIQARRAGRAHSAADDARTARLLAFLDAAGLAAPGSVVASYGSMPGEPDTWAVIDELRARGVRVLLPVLRRQPAWAWYAGREQLTPSWHDIPEPTTPRLAAESLWLAQAIVVSGLAGAPSGARVGTGGGWYDRALTHAATSARTIVLLNDDEVLPEVPRAPWDRLVDVIVTPVRSIVTEWGAGRGAVIAAE